MRNSTSPVVAAQLFNQFLQPVGAWIAIACWAGISTLLTLAHAGSLMRLGFPLGSLVTGLYLYFTAPALYVGFTWWIWFLSPWLRRVVDYSSGWVDPNPILLTPPLVTMVMGITLIRKIPSITKEGGLPFIFSISAVLYSYFIGIIQAPFIPASIALLNWLPPILFAFHILTNWRDYPKYRANIQQVFLWGTLVMGTYGIVQFLIVPPWDKFWMLMSKLNSIGYPVPLQVRVFSTMNAPNPFALVMMVGLLLLLVNVKPLGFAAAAVGYLSFLISLVRAAWLGWAVGLLSLVGTLKASLQMRLLVIMLVMAIAVLPLTTMEPFSKTIGSRLESLSNVQEDYSFRERAVGYEQALDMVLSQGLGAGMGAADAKTGRFDNMQFSIGVRDSTVLEMMYTFGWVGVIPYMGGFCLLVINMMLAKVVKFDAFAGAARAIALGVVAQFALGSIFVGVSGVVIWVFSAMVLAAQRHYNFEHQLNKQANLIQP